jgi:hypothetical protein
LWVGRVRGGLTCGLWVVFEGGWGNLFCPAQTAGVCVVVEKIVAGLEMGRGGRAAPDAHA